MSKVVRLFDDQEQQMQDEPVDRMSGGFVKLYRRILDEPFAHDPVMFSAWVKIILLATHRPIKTFLGRSRKAVTLQPGQFISGRYELAKLFACTENEARTIITYFERQGMIERQVSNFGTVFTVCRYSEYQSESHQHSTSKNHQQNHQRKHTAGAGLSENATSETTSTKPSESTTRQEYKNIKPNTSTDVDVSDSDESLLLQSAEEIAAPEKQETEKSAAEKTKPELPACPHDEILNAWAEIMPGKRQPKRNLWKHSSHADNLKHRWNQGFKIMHSSGTRTLYHDKESGIAFWRALFTMCSKSEFLMRDESSWFNLQWITKKSNFIKLLDRDFYQGGRHD